MTELMKLIAKKRLFKVTGFALNETRGISHLDEGQLYAAVDEQDAVAQATHFWTEEMGFETFTGIAKSMDRVGDYKIVLVYDGQPEIEEELS